MNMLAPILAPDPVLTRTEAAGLVALAARTVPPLWPLESAIAVNPLAGFEELPFADAVHAAAARFGARDGLPLGEWRKLLALGRIDERSLRDAAVRHLGGTYDARTAVAPGVTALDLLMARLLDLPAAPALQTRGEVAPDAAFVAKWCAAFFDGGQAAAPMPHRELGLYRAVLAMATHDPDFRALAGAPGNRLLLTVARDPLEAVAEGLAALKVPEGKEVDHLAGLVARLPGWAGHLRWRSEHADPATVEHAPAGMADLLALWLLLERAGALTTPAVCAPDGDCAAELQAHFGLSAADLARSGTTVARVVALTEGDLGGLFQQAAEWTLANDLVPRLQAAALPSQAVDATEPDAQLVFCIDVRSEPFRRALEAEGRFETLGYAGFFGLPIALHRHGAQRRQRLLPVLLSPQHDISEAPVPGKEDEAHSLALADALEREAARLFGRAKQAPATAFAAAEATGPLLGLAMAARTLAPRLTSRLAGALAPERSEAFGPSLVAGGHSRRDGVFTLAEKIGYAQALFRLTGLPANTARLVALVGHGGNTVNNPYSAALDCGACGGHAGGSNARILVAMLNDPEVRAGLAQRGLALPAASVFVAAEHDTTTDTVTIFDRASVPRSHAGDLARLEAALARAGEANRERRAALLGRSADDLLAGAVHWGEVRPEWGLAGNAAFIAAPRALSQGIDLGGRAFLHSYDWRTDADGTALATILTAPMVVAQWINCQYLFSTLDNERYGSGDKVTQNVVGRIGVVQGNGGDLRVGLPRQSLFADDGTPYHVPQRLLTVVLAPPEQVKAVVAANDILQRLFGNGWVTLVVIDPATGRARRWRADNEPASEGTTLHSITL